MDANRYGEVSHTPFRSQRLFSVNGQWYFDTREGEQIGPYHDHNEVNKALAVFIARRLLSLEKSRINNKELHYGAQDNIEHMVEELLGYFGCCNEYGLTPALAGAKNRFEEIMENINDFSNSKERMEVLQYATDQET